MIDTLELEQSVLGTMLVSPLACEIGLQAVVELDFSDSGHQIMFEALGAIFDGSNVSVQILLDYVKTTKTDEGLMPFKGQRVAGYIAQCIEKAELAHNIEWICNQLTTASAKRQLMHETREITAICHDDSITTPSEVISKAQERLTMLEMGTIRPDDTASNVQELIEKERAFLLDPEKTVERIKTGITALDEMIVGVSRGDLVVVAGRPGHGKTAIAGNFVESMAMNGNKILFWSIEMGKNELVQRIACTIAKVNSKRYESKSLYKGEFEKIDSAFSLMRKWNFTIDENPSPTVNEIVARTRCHKRRFGLDVVFVDYVGLINTGTGKQKQRYEQIGDITRSLKTLGKSLDVAVVLLCQLNRQADGEPQLGHLRESGNIEQDADKVILIHQKTAPEEMRAAGVNDGFDAVLKVAKNRGGQCGRVHVVWLPQITRFMCEADKPAEEMKNYNQQLAEF